MKLSSLSKTTLLLFFCFGIDKITAIIRQLIIARQFGLSSELDVFNIANNLPDMLFILISGGAMSMVLIPVMTEVMIKDGRMAAWHLFSSVANLAFLGSLFFAVIIALLAEPIIASEIGIAPGFSTAQKKVVAELMRMNLIATMIFSISGLIMGGLQANRHFLMPALAPILYNAGQIFGALILAPSKPYVIGTIQLPYLGMGVHGLAAGVILGAVLHLLIQIPALLRYQFRWSPVIALHEESVRKLLRIMGPRILSVFFIQLIFIVRDNLASRLSAGAVTALSYGYMFQQLPETLIGTVLGTAILPSLSLFISKGERASYESTIQKACRLCIGLSFGSAVIMGIGLQPLIQFAFHLDTAQTSLLIWTLRGFLVGLAGHCLLETVNRAFYAQQEAILPLIGTFLNLVLYVLIGSLLFRSLDAPGISLTDSIAFTIQSVFLLLMMKLSPETRLRWLQKRKLFWKRFLVDHTGQSIQMAARTFLGNTILRSGIGALVSGLVCYVLMGSHFGNLNILVKSLIGMALAIITYIPFILPELKILRHF